ncbi:MAG TPA: ABC transporter substrate-binding protein [Gemmatimonadales bacterium]|nr:ABC transporter substrate-binding protein [Gemmatimonadales bacterium]
MRVTALLVLTLVVACGPTAARRGNTVILASGADLESINPLLTTHPLARQVQRYALLTTLVRYDSALTTVPYLATSWTWSRDSLALTFRIFSGLRWTDGVPTSAYDAAWTLERAIDPVTGYPRLADLADLADVWAADDTTLELRFSRRQRQIPDVLTDLAVLPAHLLDSVPAERLRRAGWNQKPVGNGPFRFVSHRPGRRWVFERNPDFPAALGGPPQLQRFVVAVVDEPTTKLAALTSGELDFAGINPAHAEFVRKNPDLMVLDYPLLFTYAVILNTRRPPFDRFLVRRAMMLPVNRDAIVNGVLFGYGTPAGGPLPPPMAPDDEKPPLYAPGRAIPLLGDSTLRFELLTVGSGEAALEQMLQAQYAAVGIKATIRQLELATYLDRVQGPSHDFDAAVMGIPGDLGAGQLARLLALSGLRAVGPPERLLRTFADSTPAVFLYHARGVQGINRRVQGVRMDLRGELVNLSDWHVTP